MSNKQAAETTTTTTTTEELLADSTLYSNYDNSEEYDLELEQQALYDMHVQESMETKIARDCNGTRIMEQDTVRILYDGGWKVGGKTGKLIKLGDGDGDQCCITITVDSFPLQNRLGQNVEFVSRPVIDELTHEFSDFRLGQHQK